MLNVPCSFFSYSICFSFIILMFKKRQKTNKTIDLKRQIDEDKDDKNDNEQKTQFPRPQQRVILQSKKINRFSVKQPQPKPAQPPKSKFRSAEPQNPEVKYGLIEKEASVNKTQNDALIQLYVKQKMKEMANDEPKVNDQTQNTAEQVMKIQRKYLQPTQSKIASYDTTQLQKKLETMSTELIRQQQEKRTEYLKNLLENELERIEYASKKQLKDIRQQREKDEKYLTAAYLQQGRRYMVNKMKKDVLYEAIRKN